MKSTLLALLLSLQLLLAQLSAKLPAQPKAVIGRSPPTPSAPMINRPIVEPEILTVTPSHGPVGTLITIKGRGFEQTANAVYASYATLLDQPSSDGETITLKVEPPGLPPNLRAIKTAEFPNLHFRFYIKNQNGVTSAPGEFTLDL